MVAGHCEHNKEFSTPMNHIKFPDCLKHYQPLKEDCVLWFYLVR
jgi:hypothetical protein